MGASHSRDLKIQDSDQDHHTSDEEHHYEDAMATLNPIKLYLHTGGKSPTATWLTCENLTSYVFIKTTDNDDDDNENEFWMLKVGAKIRVKVSAEMKMKSFGDQRRVDFISNGVWAMKFYKSEGFNEFVKRFEDCLFENTYRCEANEENRVRVYGAAEDSVWEDAEEDFEAPMVRANNDGMLIRSLVLGGLDNSFLVGDGKVQVVRNSRDGIDAKGAYVSVYSGSKKAVLMRAETTMMMMKDECDHGNDHGIHQLDIETGKVVREWRFDVGIRDITNDSKEAQLDPCGSTFLGLNGNRLCRWDMRDRGDSTSVLSWDQGHEFAKGTGFECFATTGDGSIVVGSRDGKIRLYLVNSMRQAKTAFRGLGCPITHVDVTYDGKWILGTSDAYLVLLCTLFVDKDGKTKTGFSGRMGNKISAPRLLKLTPLDAHLAGADKFRRAQFSWVTEQGKQERHLVATVGKFSVIWNFQQVKDSSHECYQNQQSPKSCYCYKIVLKDDSIVDSRFMHDKFSVTDSPEAPLVVATSMKVSSFSISAIKRL